MNVRNRLVVIAGLLVLALGAAPQARAAAVPFDASLSITLNGGSVPLQMFMLDRTGVAIVNASGGAVPLSSFTVPASLFATTAFVVDVSDPAAFPILGFQATLANLAGAFSTSAGALGGVMPLLGVAKVCLFEGCNEPVVPANLSVPLSVVGVGGTAVATLFVNVTIEGAPWTTATIGSGSVTTAGFAHGPGSAASTAAKPGGTVRLVTPVLISTNIPSSAILPSFGFLDLSFVPEPGSLLLLGSGLACLAVGAHRRMQRDSQRAPEGSEQRPPPNA